MSQLPNILFFKDIDKNDTDIVGGKGANLGEMTKAGFPVPGGFSITIRAYDEFLQENNIVENIYNQLKVIDVNDPAQLDSVARRIQKMVTAGRVPDDLAKEVISSYKKLSGRFKNSRSIFCYNVRLSQLSTRRCR